MAHTYSSITKSDNTYTAVSDVTPISGTVEDKFTWANIVPNQDTWLELLINGGKVRWADWYYATAFTDAWTSLTTPSSTYTGVTKSDNSFSSITTPTATYSEIGRAHV